MPLEKLSFKVIALEDALAFLKEQKQLINAFHYAHHLDLKDVNLDIQKL